MSARGGGFAGGMIVHHPMERVTALISENVSNHPDLEGTGIGVGKSFEVFIITFRHVAFRPVIFDYGPP
jgi:hypothetical protein